MKQNANCNSSHPYCCKFCTFIGFNHSGLNKHLSIKPSCQYHYDQLPLIQGKMPDTSSHLVLHQSTLTDGYNQTSYFVDRYSANGTRHNVNLNINDHGSSKKIK